MLRNSKFRDNITTLEKGSFVFPELDLKMIVQPFQQEGVPYLWQPKATETATEQQQKPKSYFKEFIKAFFSNRPTQTQSLKDKEDLEDSQADGLFTDEEDIMFPEEEF